jgi:hypothetical protein
LDAAKPSERAFVASHSEQKGSTLSPSSTLHADHCGTHWHHRGSATRPPHFIGQSRPPGHVRAAPPGQPLRNTTPCCECPSNDASVRGGSSPEDDTSTYEHHQAEHMYYPLATPCNEHRYLHPRTLCTFLHSYPCKHLPMTLFTTPSHDTYSMYIEPT